MQHQTFARETPQQIEARLADDRKALSSALNALGAKLTPDALWSNGLSLVKSNSAVYAQVVDRAIRANPFAVALTGVGLAWLIFGQRRSTTDADDDAPLPGTHLDAVARWEDEGGPVTETVVQTPGADDEWIRDADRLRDRAQVLFAQMDTALRRKTAAADDLARHRADVTAALTRDVRRIMGRGLEHLTDDARTLALAARERVYTTYVQTGGGVSGTIAQRPLATGAVFAAAGALLAALLPQAAAENRALGGPRDDLIDALRAAIGDEAEQLSHAAHRIVQSVLNTPLDPQASEASPTDRN